MWSNLIFLIVIIKSIHCLSIKNNNSEIIFKNNLINNNDNNLIKNKLILKLNSNYKKSIANQSTIFNSDFILVFSFLGTFFGYFILWICCSFGCPKNSYQFRKKQHKNEPSLSVYYNLRKPINLIKLKNDDIKLNDHNLINISNDNVIQITNDAKGEINSDYVSDNYKSNAILKSNLYDNLPVNQLNKTVINCTINQTSDLLNNNSSNALIDLSLKDLSNNLSNKVIDNSSNNDSINNSSNNLINNNLFENYFIQDVLIDNQSLNNFSLNEYNLITNQWDNLSNDDNIINILPDNHSVKIDNNLSYNHILSVSDFSNSVNLSQDNLSNNNNLIIVSSDNSSLSDNNLVNVSDNLVNLPDNALDNLSNDDNLVNVLVINDDSNSEKEEQSFVLINLNNDVNI